MKQFEERGYQKDVSLRVRSALKDNRKVILQMPTGAGKTKVASDFAERAINKNIITVFLSDRKEILRQTAKTFTAHKIDFSLVDASVKQIHYHRCYIGMVETFYRRLSAGKFDHIPIGLVILDEAHMGNYSKLIKVLDEKIKPYIIGLTATPISSSAKLPLKKLYDSIVCGPSISWLIDNGFLVRSVDVGQDTLYEFDKKNGEFSEESQLKIFQEKENIEKMFQLWKGCAENKRTIIYNVNISHNNQIAEYFAFNGYSCKAVSSETADEERDQATKDFQSGNIQILCNVGIYTKGFDCPEIECVVVNRATDSLTLWYQMIGRGGRPFLGKDHFITLDMGNNILRHGSYNDNIDWETMFKNDERRRGFSEKLPIPHLCPTCFAYIYNKYITSCPVCGDGVTEKSLIKLEVVIPDYIKKKQPHELKWNEIPLYAKWKNYKNGWVWYMRQKLKASNSLNRAFRAQ